VIVQELNDTLPFVIPEISPEEVEQFVALGKEGSRRLRKGDEAGAEKAFRGQLAIYGGNPDPFVSLALLEARRGSEKKALENLRHAVLRGFRDLRRIQRAEIWGKIGQPHEYRMLLDAIPRLDRAERAWPAWAAFPLPRVPEDPDVVLSRHAEVVALIDAMAPALGSRQVGLWMRYLDRAAAAQLEGHVVKNPEDPKLDEVLQHLMKLYAGGPLGRWERLPAEINDRLAKVSATVLDRFPESPVRPEALVGIALAWDWDRDKRGALKPEAIELIRTRLEEVVASYPDSPVYPTAVVGLIRTDFDVGDLDRAEKTYVAFREAHVEESELFALVQENLGELALRVGGVPPFRATALDGSAVELASLRGKVGVLDFWATWCPPCVAEFPTLRKINERYGDAVVLLGVNMDDADALSSDSLRRWIAEAAVPGTHLFDGLSWESDLVASCGVREIPFNVVIDPKGNVVEVNAHGRSLERAVRLATRR
jgi:thiol-disulfide isomerase/thioredoxin